MTTLVSSRAPEKVFHGGGIDAAIAHFGGEFSGWLDLSTGINPESFALPDLPLNLWHRLPDDSVLQWALSAARGFYGAEPQAQLAAAPGTQALIQIMPLLADAGDMAILTPTYQEYAASFQRSGWNVHSCAALEDIPEHVSVVVVVNPNNPDGRYISAKQLLNLARELGRQGGFLIVDEAFADVHEGASLVSYAKDEPLIVLKSFGKFFGLAGVRLGFAFSNLELIEKIAARLGPWAVSGPALAIAQAAFTSEDLDSFRRRIEERREGLSAVFARCNLEEIGGTNLFSLVQCEEAHALWQHLAEQYIWVRKFDYAPNWLRVGLAKEPADLKRLEDALLTFKA
ncbi:Histidinol-phosphate aminotransferase [Paenochrobactrum sp. BZR 201-1]